MTTSAQTTHYDPAEATADTTCHDVTITWSNDTERRTTFTVTCFRCPLEAHPPLVISAPINEEFAAFLDVAMRHARYTVEERDNVLAVYALGTQRDAQWALWEMDDSRCPDTTCRLHRREGLF